MIRAVPRPDLGQGNDPAARGPDRPARSLTARSRLRSCREADEPMTRWRRARSASGGAQRGASREERPIEGAPPEGAEVRPARDRRRPRRIPRAAVAGELRRSLAVGRDDLMAMAKKASTPFGRRPEALLAELGEVPMASVNHPRKPRAISRLAQQGSRGSRRSHRPPRDRSGSLPGSQGSQGSQASQASQPKRSPPRRRENRPADQRSRAVSPVGRRSLASALASSGSVSRISALTSARRSSPARRSEESSRRTNGGPRSSGSVGSATTSRRSLAARSTSRRRRSPQGRRGSSSVGSACSIRLAIWSSPRHSTSSARTGAWNGI